MAEITCTLRTRRSRWFPLAVRFAMTWFSLRSRFPGFCAERDTRRVADFVVRFIKVEVGDAVAIQ